MSETYMIAFDGSAPSHNALKFGAKIASASGGRLVLAHVLEWSPYSFLTAEELEQRHKRREEEKGRAEQVILKPVKDRLTGDGLEVETVVRYGHAAEVICDLAREMKATQLIVGRTGSSAIQARLFGSVSASLAQMSPVPCTIVP